MSLKHKMLNCSLDCHMHETSLPLLYDMRSAVYGMNSFPNDVIKKVIKLNKCAYTYYNLPNIENL